MNTEPFMKSLVHKYMTGIIILASVVLLLAGCKDSGNGGDDAGGSETKILLDEAFYLALADDEQPTWLQDLINESLYLKVFHSNARGGLYLVVFPQRGFAGTLYNKNGKTLAQSSDDEWAEMVGQGSPWTCTHVYTPALKPGDAEWDLNRYTAQEIQQKLLLPDALLKQMTTADLLEVCLDYQYSTDFLAYNETQLGIQALRKNFNGYNELLQRKDLVEVMLMKYLVRLRSVETMAQQESRVVGSFSLHFLLFKMLLAQEEMLSSMSREQQRMLIALSIEAWNIVAEQPDLFGTIHYSPILFLFSRIIVRNGGFKFTSDEERQMVEYYAETCTGNPKMRTVFTEDFQKRMFSYLQQL